MKIEEVESRLRLRNEAELQSAQADAVAKCSEIHNCVREFQDLRRDAERECSMARRSRNKTLGELERMKSSMEVR